MFKQLSFQAKLMLTYSVFIVVLIIVLSVTFFFYNSHLFEENAMGNLSQLVKKISQQLDSCVEVMDKASLEIMGDEELILALTDIHFNRDNYIDDIRYLQKTLVKESIYKENIYRASIFNSHGDFFSSTKYEENSRSIKNTIQTFPWLKEAREKNGDKFILSPHIDYWNKGEKSEVFSLIRLVKDPGNEIGFIEIQVPTQKLKEICNLNNSSDIKIIVFDRKGSIIYSNYHPDKEAINSYMKFTKGKSDQTYNLENTLYNEPEIISLHTSSYTDWSVVLLQNRTSLLAPLRVTRNLTFTIGICIIFITLVFFFVFAYHLTRPLRKLKETIEQINLGNLPDTQYKKHQSNEIQALDDSFQKMRSRLNEAIEHEMQSHSLSLEAHLYALQAQIHPHFLYNMLGVLSNMGDEAEQYEISATCQSLAKMLRYSTSTTKVESTIKEEIEHANNYLSLMKRRFEHRLEFNIDVDALILHISLPKLIIQPLVENSISHGFEMSSGVMNISINGGITGDNWWIQIIDNGTGFETKILEALKEKIDYYSKSFLKNPQELKLSIGGMGLINTFARLLLFFRDKTHFELSNNDSGGACISIGGSLNPDNSEEESSNVQNYDCR